MGDCGFILVIDHDLVTCGIVESLSERIGCDVRAAWDGEEALEFLSGDAPALAVVEVELPKLSGLAVLRELQARFGDDLPVILTSAERTTAHDRTAGLLLGADDYLVKPLDPAELAARIRRLIGRARAGNGVEDGNGNGRPEWLADVRLSPRELQILTLLGEGKTQKEIAATLVISPKTVATHIQHLLAKLGVNSRAQAVAAAYRRGLVGGDVEAHGRQPGLVGAG